MRILISGGGTGGHIYPALAVAAALRDQYGAELLYIGDENGLETDIVPAAGVPFAPISAGKLRRYLSARTFGDLARIPRGMAQALGHARRFRPHAAFTSGGYVSVPAGVAARLTRAPLVMHQQDVPPNLANRLLTPFATRISVSFAASLPYFPRDRVALMGNPVRAEVLAAANLFAATPRPRFGLDPALPVLLVTGGSQGARRLNQVVAGALPQLLPYTQVLHVSGELTYDETRARADQALSRLLDGPGGEQNEALRARYALYPYLRTEMPEAIAASDLILCRSGAATLTELAIIGRPSVLVPLPPGFTGSPQATNAAMFQRAGAAEVILDRELNAERAVSLITALLGDPTRRVAMAEAARGFARPNATRDLAAAVAALAARREEQERRAAR
jgi:UDP-N-acetylglucosamine--N-acetylmuramyl-(pentapeptide) pyrophosphoryl-undecaprenol N-acetylglucosamine transferase